MAAKLRREFNCLKVMISSKGLFQAPTYPQTYCTSLLRQR